MFGFPLSNSLCLELILVSELVQAIAIPYFPELIFEIEPSAGSMVLTVPSFFSGGENSNVYFVLTKYKDVLS